MLCYLVNTFVDVFVVVAAVVVVVVVVSMTDIMN